MSYHNLNNNRYTMNKQNSMVLQNEPSTQIHDSIKSYSSRFNKLKALKGKKVNKTDILPYKLQKAAVTIQRFYRFRLSMRRKLYTQLIQQLFAYNEAVQFQNDKLDQLTLMYSSECQTLCKISQLKIKAKTQNINKQSNAILKDLARTTFKLQQKRYPSELHSNLCTEYSYEKQMIMELQKQKKELQYKLQIEYQEQEQMFLKAITQETGNLLKISKKRNQMEKLMRNKILEMEKENLKI